MDIKGAIINLSTFRSLYKIIDNFDYSSGFLKGVDGFNLNPLDKFKEEFSDVVKAIEQLDAHIFKKHELQSKHEFVVHFENDVAEMDCVTFLNINNAPFFVDIEVKNTEHFEQLDDQFENRETDTLPQLNLSENYLLIGFLNGKHKKSILKHGSKRIVIEKINDLVNALQHLNNEIIDTRLLLKDVEGILKIQDVKNKIVANDFKYYSATRDAINSIVDNIKNGKKIIIVHGNAGCGKTVIALSLFFKYQDVKLLVINKNLYNVLSLSRYYRNNTCFFGTNSFINAISTKDVAIIDECQRLSCSDIKEISSRAKCVVLLGDSNQAFTRSDVLLDENELKNSLIESYGFCDSEIVTKKIKKTARYNSKVNQLLEILHNGLPINSCTNSIKEKVGDEFAIDITMSSTSFMDKYNSLSSSSRIYTPFFHDMPTSIKVGGTVFNVAGKDDGSFSVSNYYSNFIGNTFHAISFDVDNSFVILARVGLCRRNEMFFFYDRNCDPNSLSEEELLKFSNQINILFTRGRKSLHILTDDFYVYSYLNYKIKRGVK